MPRQRREIPWLDTRGGVYYVFWYDAETRRTERLSLDTKEAATAQDRYAAFLAEGKAAFIKGPAGLTVGEALDYYLTEHLSNFPIKERVNANLKIEVLTAYFKDTLLKSIGVPECDNYAKARREGFLRGRPVTNSTVASELSLLRAAANHNLRYKRINLAEMPTFNMPETPRSKGIWLFEDELQRLFDGAGRWEMKCFMPLYLRSALELSYYTASRRNAIENLKWEQVDLFRGRITLLADGQAVTRKRKPTVPIDPKLMPTLLHLQKHRRNDWVLGFNQPFYNPMIRMAKENKLYDLPQRAGRPASTLSPHMLRHSRATHLLQAGKSLWQVAGLLGDTVATVEAVYGHHSVEFLNGMFREEAVPSKVAALLD